MARSQPATPSRGEGGDDLISGDRGRGAGELKKNQFHNFVGGNADGGDALRR